MTIPRHRQENVGRTEYQLRMPYPGDHTPEGIRTNFRELERWGNALPVPRPDTFVPYFIEYTPEDAEDDWDVDLVSLLQARYDTDLMPTGMWLVGAVIHPDWSALTDVVGVRAGITIGTPLMGVSKSHSIGNTTGAIRVVKDIDFITPEVTYEWVLPVLDPGSGYDALTVQDIKVVEVGVAADTISVEVYADAFTIIDPDVGPDLFGESIPSRLSVFAYRMTDFYGIPRSIESVEPL